ncbi:hypothetical protein [Azohydromonas lata]|uniref:hypothetical protein n=1 Tax=Azohydromonas lata TaxID=45677 RepID=UPI00082A7CEB|nr:hypothetical protein [Azohydromonas lata]
MTPRKILAAAALALALAGCATTKNTDLPHGGFLPARIDPQPLVNDAVRQLSLLYPPAKTRLLLQQDAPDAFGQALLKTLRSSGYAVQEKDAKGTPSEAQPLRYIADQATGLNLYRVVVAVGSQSLARAYTETNGTLVPAGAWVRKE